MREEWKEVALQDLCIKIQSGGTPSTKRQDYYNGNIPWIKTKEVNFEKIYNSENKITELGLKNSSAKLIPERSILIAMYGNGDTAGRCAMNMIPLATNQACTNFTFNESLACPEYMFYKIASHYNDFVHLKSGGAQNNLNGKILKEFKVKLPPLPIQRRIASILSAYDDLIENNLKRIKLLEEKAQLTYEEWFVRLHFPGHEKVKIDKESGLPEGWLYKKLSSIAKINAKSIKKDFDGNIDYIDIASVSPGKIESTTKYNIKEAPGRAKRIVTHGDIIWSCVRPNRKSHSIIWNPSENLIASTGFCVITPKLLPTSFLLQYVTTNDFVGYLNNRAGGAAYPAVKAIDFKDADILMPNEELVNKYDLIFKNSLEISWNLQKQNQHLKEARDILLPRLMTGMIDVDKLKLESVEDYLMVAEDKEKYGKSS